MSDLELREAVQRWIGEAGLSFSAVDVAEIQEGDAYSWALMIDGQSLRTLVAGRPDSLGGLYMQIALDVSEAHRQAIAAMDEKTRTLLIFDLRLALLRTPVGHWISFDNDENPSYPLQVGVGINLFEEPIERAGFLRRNHQLQTAARIAILMIQRAVFLQESQ